MIYKGVDLLTIARVVEDSGARYEAEAPAVFPVASVSIPDEGGFTIVSKDGESRNAYAIGAEQTLTIETQAISPDFINAILYGGEEPAFFDSGLPETNYFALGFRLSMADGSHTYYSYQKGTITVNSKSVQTAQGTSATVESITYTPVVTDHVFLKTGKPSRKIVVNSNRHSVNVAGWLAIVWTPDNFLEVPAPTLNAREENGAYIVTMSTPRGTDGIYYTLDGTTPTLESPVYKEPLTLQGGAIIKAVSCAVCKNTSGVTILTLPLKDIAENPILN